MKFTFDKTSVLAILEIFGKEIDKEGFIVEKKDKSRSLTKKGEEIHIEQFGGFSKRNGLIKNDLPTLIEISDDLLNKDCNLFLKTCYNSNCSMYLKSRDDHCDMGTGFLEECKDVILDPSQKPVVNDEKIAKEYVKKLLEHILDNEELLMKLSKNVYKHLKKFDEENGVIDGK